MTGVSTKNGVIEKAMVGLVEKHLFLDLVQRLKLEIILRLVDTGGTVDTCFQILRIPHVYNPSFGCVQPLRFLIEYVGCTWHRIESRLFC